MTSCLTYRLLLVRHCPVLSKADKHFGHDRPLETVAEAARTMVPENVKWDLRCSILDEMGEDAKSRHGNVGNYWTFGELNSELGVFRF